MMLYMSLGSGNGFLVTLTVDYYPLDRNVKRKVILADLYSDTFQCTSTLFLSTFFLS